MPMKEKEVTIRSRVNGEQTRARLLLCPDCEGESFFCFFPEGIEHSHFQCCNCGTTFCDGCTDLPANTQGEQQRC